MTKQTEAEAALSTERKKYATALGEFVMTWADTEAEMYMVLKYYAGLSDSVARAIFSGTRARPMVDYMRAIIHNEEIDEVRKKDLEFVFSQIIAINTMRDRVIHFSSANVVSWQQDDPSTRYISNTARVSRYGNHFVEKVGSKIIKSMVYDLYAIQNHLNRHWCWHQPVPFSPWEEYPGEQTTWLYKPAQPKNASQQRERAPRK